MNKYNNETFLAYTDKVSRLQSVSSNAVLEFHQTSEECFLSSPIKFSCETNIENNESIEVKSLIDFTYEAYDEDKRHIPRSTKTKYNRHLFYERLNNDTLNIGRKFIDLNEILFKRDFLSAENNFLLILLILIKLLHRFPKKFQSKDPELENIKEQD